MNTHAKFRLILATTFVAAILAMQPQSCWAEDTTTPGTSPKSEYERAASAPPVYNTTTGATTKSQAERVKKQKMESEAAATAPTYDIVIANGVLVHGGKKDPEPPTLGAAIEVLRKCQPDANIVVGPGLSDLPIGELKLHAHSVVEVLQALRAASGDKFDWRGPNSPDANVPGTIMVGGIDPSTGLPLAPGAPDPNTGLYVLREVAHEGSTERVVEAFNLGRYIERSRINNGVGTSGTAADQEHQRAGFAEETFLQVSQIVVDTVASFKQVDVNLVKQHLKFQSHLGANLMIVVGEKEDVEAARKVVNALTAEEIPISRKGEWDAPAHLNNGGGGSSSGQEPLTVEIIPLKHVAAGEVVRSVRAVFTDTRSKVVTDERAHSLVVMGTAFEIAAAKRAVALADQPNKPAVGNDILIR